MVTKKQQAALLAVVAVAALAQVAAAAVHPVGGNGAWDTTGNYNAWSVSQKFSQGDSIRKHLDRSQLSHSIHGPWPWHG